jgi:hypothetical protein
MSLVKTPSTKAEGECHSSIFYGLVENEKMNERHVATISNTAENKGGSKQDSWKSMMVVFFKCWKCRHL